MNLRNMLMSRAISGGGGIGKQEGLPYVEKTESVFEWDGDTTGYVEGYVGSVFFYKMSDEVYTNDQLVGTKVVLNFSQVGTDYDHVVTNEDFLVFSGSQIKDIPYVSVPFSGGGPTQNLPALVVVSEPYIAVEETVFLPERGTYFAYIRAFGMHVKSLSLMTEPREIVHKLDPKFLPEGVPHIETVDGESVFEFDGDLTGKETVDLSEFVYVKVSDEPLSKEELSKTIPTLFGDFGDGHYMEREYSADEIQVMEFPLSDDAPDCMVVMCQTPDGYTLYYSFPEDERDVGFSKGVWFLYYEDNTGKMYTKSIYIPPRETIHKLDPKFLPKGYPYVKTVEVELIPEGGLEDYGGEWGVSPAPIMPVEGKTYTVTYNGKVYNTIAHYFEEFGDAFVLGNVGATGLPGYEDSGEPFVFVFKVGDFAEPGFVKCVPFDGASEVNVSVKGFHEVVEKLDGSFYDSVIYYYINEDRPSGGTSYYLYKDPECHIKVTRDDLKQAQKKSIVVLYDDGNYARQFYVNSVNIDSYKGYVVIGVHSGISNSKADVSYYAYFTATDGE